MGEILRVEGVSRIFGKGRNKIVALDDVSFAVGGGEIVGVLGVNGAGKTTLLKIISTLLLPTRGRVWVSGVDIVRSPRQAQRAMSVVLGGDRGFYNRVSARENVRFMATLSGLAGNELRERTETALEQVGLADVADRPVETFSKGMRQRLHLAVGMTTRPPFVLLDEPTIGLDALEAQRLRSHVLRMSEEGTAVLLTSHYVTDIERLAGRVIVLQSGRLTHDLPLARLLAYAPAAAEVTVVLREEPTHDRTPARADGVHRVRTQKAAADMWEVTYQVDAWNEAALRRLAEVWPSEEIEDVRVSPAGLEQVFAQLDAKKGEK